jgi:transposase-like protein
MSRTQVRQKWQAIFAEFERTDLSISAFCRERSLSPSSFYQWRKKLKADQPGRFLPVIIEAKAAPVRVCFPNGVMIEVHDDSHPVALQLAVSALS